MSAEASEAPRPVVGFQCRQRHDQPWQQQQLKQQQVQLTLEAAVPVPQTPRQHDQAAPGRPSLLTAALRAGAACWLPAELLDDDSDLLSDDCYYYEGDGEEHARASPQLSVSSSQPIDIPYHLAKRSRWWTPAPACDDAGYHPPPTEQPCAPAAPQAAMPPANTELQQQQHCPRKQ